MKVILRKDVGGVGPRNTIKEVSDGYALNFLIPRGLAEQATPMKIAELETHKKKEAAGAAEQDAQWAEQLKNIEGLTLVIPVKANDAGHLYRQLPASAITEIMKKEYGVSVPEEAISMEPIKSTGEFKVKIRLGKHEAGITLAVRAA